MRHYTLLLSVLLMACSVSENKAREVTLTEAAVMEEDGSVLKTVTEQASLSEIGGAWRAKVPAEAGTEMSDDFTVRLTCSDGGDSTASTWYYDKRGYVRKVSERDPSIYRITFNERLLKLLSP